MLRMGFQIFRTFFLQSANKSGYFHGGVLTSHSVFNAHLFTDQHRVESRLGCQTQRDQCLKSAPVPSVPCGTHGSSAGSGAGLSPGDAHQEGLGLGCRAARFPQLPPGTSSPAAHPTRRAGPGAPARPCTEPDPAAHPAGLGRVRYQTPQEGFIRFSVQVFAAVSFFSFPSRPAEPAAPRRAGSLGRRGPAGRASRGSAGTPGRPKARLCPSDLFARASQPSEVSSSGTLHLPTPALPG